MARIRVLRVFCTLKKKKKMAPLVKELEKQTDIFKSIAQSMCIQIILIIGMILL